MCVVDDAIWLITIAVWFKHVKMPLARSLCLLLSPLELHLLVRYRSVRKGKTRADTKDC